VKVKRITISLKAYEALLREKRPGESFSDVILRLVERCGDLMDLAGAWRDVGDEEAEELLKSLREAWRDEGWRESNPRY
ncbi:MAG: antitoxin VapB family protein, partial [Thermoproteales archaeon]|nr:antitoxin VapB family protein [Thermoproteales archaeon]